MSSYLILAVLHIVYFRQEKGNFSNQVLKNSVQCVDSCRNIQINHLAI